MMLSYRHAFHAGNFADVLKHAVLVQLVKAMQAKPGGFLYLDTHGGAGEYNLKSGLSQKIKEYHHGIVRLWGRRELPAAVQPYLELLKRFNQDGRLARYPGSPLLVCELLRPQDRLVACELHPTDQVALAQRLQGVSRTRVEATDGLHALRAHWPPQERRGLVHLDPAYERPEEYRQARDALHAAHQRFAGGVYALWYPMLRRREAERLPEQIAATGMRKILRIELWVRAPGQGLYGCGVLVLNPPWQFEEPWAAALPWLVDILAQEQGGGSRLEWLVPE